MIKKIIQDLLVKSCMLLIYACFIVCIQYMIIWIDVFNKLDVEDDNFRKLQIENIDVCDDVEDIFYNTLISVRKEEKDKIIAIDGEINNILLNYFFINLGGNIFKDVYNYIDIIFSELVYFPVALFEEKENEIYYTDSWETKRSYGGERKHEGTDIMAVNNKSGYYPVISITDGVVENIGWLELGGYRIGIRTEKGLYLYYAHLDSYANDLDKGDEVCAGQILGFMGNTGYSKIEGTNGKFDVHLHMGIYVKTYDKEVSLNPFFLLKYLEKTKIYYKNCK